MRDIIELASRKKIGNINNFIIDKSFKASIKEDRTIRIITKEITDYIMTLFEKRLDN
jgi:hypothetical protein